MTTIYTATVKVGLCISSVLFLIAVVLVPAFKLHTLLVYRLALYQVIGAKLFFVVYASIQLMLLDGDLSPLLVLTLVCSSIGYFNGFLTLWINFHLCVLSVCHKNLKRLEHTLCSEFNFNGRDYFDTDATA